MRIIITTIASPDSPGKIVNPGSYLITEGLRRSIL